MLDVIDICSSLSKLTRYNNSFNRFVACLTIPKLKFRTSATINFNSRTREMPGVERQNESAATAAPSRPFLIGVCGGTASGKSTVCDEINKRVAVDHPRLVGTVCQDSFYRDLTDNEKALAFAGDFNFDHPDAMDGQLMLQLLQNIKAGHPVQIPKYDYRTHSRVYEESKTVEPADVVLVEGILIFYYKDIRDLFDMKLFVDTDPDTRLARRVQRDINERGRSLQNILHQYLTLVKPAYEEFCLPTKKYADVIIPRGAENKVAIDLIVQHIQEILRGSSSRNNRGSVSSTLSATVNRTRNVSNDTVRGTTRPH